jgi:hypothetical protein
MSSVLINRRESGALNSKKKDQDDPSYTTCTVRAHIITLGVRACVRATVMIHL